MYHALQSAAREVETARRDAKLQAEVEEYLDPAMDLWAHFVREAAERPSPLKLGDVAFRVRFAVKRAYLAGRARGQLDGPGESRRFDAPLWPSSAVLLVAAGCLVLGTFFGSVFFRGAF